MYDIIGQTLRHGLRRGFDHKLAVQSAKIAVRHHGGKSKSGELPARYATPWFPGCATVRAA